MNRTNPWAFGIVFLAVFVYLAWNNFELPVIMPGKKTETTGTILNTDWTYGLSGRGFHQLIDYVYMANDSFYFHRKKITKKHGSRKTGNKILVQYSEKKPERHRVKGFYSSNRPVIEEKYIASLPDGYNEMVLTNGVFRHTKYKQGGTVLQIYYGEFNWRNDSLNLFYYLSNSEMDKDNPAFLLAEFDDQGRTILLDEINQWEYRKL